MKSNLVLGLLASFAILTVQSQSTVNLQRCGRDLSDALAVFCNGQLIKRSDMRQIDMEMDWPWIPPQQAHALRSKRQTRKLQTVVTECCDKPCSINELMTYCGY